ncbi:MAG: tRNA (adenosine(37)-N6)-dimethylallyltransferase MiaA, partial [Chitinophagaceae bacterium]
GLDQVPSIPSDIRAAIIQSYEGNGIGWLQEQLQEKDPAFFEKGEMKNPQRMMRALEVIEATGQSILDFRKGHVAERDFTMLKIGLELPREELYQRINTRVDQMMSQGLLEEVRSLLPFKHLNALQTVGYAELFAYLDQQLTLDAATELIKQNTRRYAKRQMTWFKKDAAFNWFNPEQLEAIRGFIMSKISGAH